MRCRLAASLHLSSHPSLSPSPPAAAGACASPPPLRPPPLLEQDLAFKQLHPAEYAELRERLEAQQRPETLVRLIDTLRGELEKEGIR